MMEKNTEDKYKEHIFKVYKNEFISILGNIYLIITYGIYDPSGYAEDQRFGEYFVLFPDKEFTSNDTEVKLNSQRIIFPIYQEQYNLDYYLKDKQKYFLDQSQEIGTIAIQNILNLQYKKINSKAITTVPLKFIESQETDLLGIFMRNKCESEFNEILKLSKCVTLKKYIRSIKSSQKFIVVDLQAEES